MDYVKNKSQIIYQILPYKKFNFYQNNHEQEAVTFWLPLLVFSSELSSDKKAFKMPPQLLTIKSKSEDIKSGV